jgi:hypothetical protein
LSQSENLTISNRHGIEDLSRWYWVNGDTWTHTESRSPNQIWRQNPQLDCYGNWAGVSASVSVSVECKHAHIVIIDSLLDLQEQGGDTDDPTIVSNITALGLYVDLRI